MCWWCCRPRDSTAVPRRRRFPCDCPNAIAHGARCFARGLPHACALTTLYCRLLTCDGRRAWGTSRLAWVFIVLDRSFHAGTVFILVVMLCAIRWQVLRRAARMLGLTASTGLVKRAIQFGSLIAKQSNQRTFGSNRQGRGDAKFEVDDD